MRIAMFERCGHRLALKLERIERILAPGADAPRGWQILDLGSLLGIEGEPPVGGSEPLVLLDGRRIALSAGLPTGTLDIEPGWILPIPGYLFAGGEGPYAGLVEIPPSIASRRPGTPANCLLVDEERLAGIAGG